MEQGSNLSTTHDPFCGVSPAALLSMTQPLFSRQNSRVFRLTHLATSCEAVSEFASLPRSSPPCSAPHWNRRQNTDPPPEPPFQAVQLSELPGAPEAGPNAAELDRGAEGSDQGGGHGGGGGTGVLYNRGSERKW